MGKARGGSREEGPRGLSGAWSLAWLALAVAACASAGDPVRSGTSEGASTLPVATRSGARLQAHFDVLGAAAEQFRVFVDTKLNVECAVALADDGTSRCLPTDTLSADDVFSDASCTKRLVTKAKSSCSKATYASRTAACPAAVSIYGVGAPVTQPIVYGLSTTGECAAQTADPETTYLELGASVPASDFVAVTKRPFAEGNLETVMLDGEDGSRTFGSFRDTKRGECAPTTLADGSLRCVPVAAATVDGTAFSDAACLVRAASLAKCVEPTVALESDACGGRAKVFSVAPVAKGYVGTKSACAAANAAIHVVSLGPEIAPADLVPLLVLPVPRGYRVAARQLAAPGGPITTGLIDADHGGPCIVGLAEDGKRRCLPTAVGPVRAFSDAACSKAVAVATCGDAPAPYAFEYADPPTTCARRQRVRALGPKLDAPAALYVRGEGGECVTTFKPAGAVYYGVGDVVAASRFAEATDQTR